MLRKLVLPDADILAGSFDAEVLANSWPELIFPRNEVVFYAVMKNTNVVKSYLLIYL